MKRKTPVSVYIVSALPVFYTILIALDAPVQITGLLFFLSPFFMAWIVVSILKSKTGNMEEFSEGEEWGYADKKKEELGMF
jgi:hypothetical protein